ncbi:hypothetical protein KCU73_g7858, partial [Aureobasidium melanogenum]
QHQSDPHASAGAEIPAQNIHETSTNNTSQTDYLGYSTDSQPFGDQSSLWQDEEKSELW